VAATLILRSFLEQRSDGFGPEEGSDG